MLNTDLLGYLPTCWNKFILRKFWACDLWLTHRYGWTKHLDCRWETVPLDHPLELRKAVCSQEHPCILQPLLVSRIYRSWRRSRRCGSWGTASFIDVNPQKENFGRLQHPHPQLEMPGFCNIRRGFVATVIAWSFPAPHHIFLCIHTVLCHFVPVYQALPDSDSHCMQERSLGRYWGWRCGVFHLLFAPLFAE